MVQKSFMSRLNERLKTANGRLLAAMACYAVLLAVALHVLLPVRSVQERSLLGIVLFVFALLIAKTLIHSQKDKQD